MAASSPVPWQTVRPRVTRYLEQQFVDLFFETGELRLSTFDMFRGHPDERCRDDQEGKVIVDCVTVDGKEMIGVAAFGLTAYVLCATTIESQSMQTKMQRDSFFRIVDTTRFAIEVAKQIPGFVGGAEGFCLYQDSRLIAKYETPSLGDPKVLESHPQRDQILQDYLGAMAGLETHFLKLTKFRDEYEYRMVWVTDRQVSDPLTIHVPDARKYCQREFVRPPDVPGAPMAKPVLHYLNDEPSSIFQRNDSVKPPWEDSV